MTRNKTIGARHYCGVVLSWPMMLQRTQKPARERAVERPMWRKLQKRERQLGNNLENNYSARESGRQENEALRQRLRRRENERSGRETQMRVVRSPEVGKAPGSFNTCSVWMRDQFL